MECVYSRDFSLPVLPRSARAHTHTCLIFIYNAPFKSPEGKVWFKQGRKKTPHKLTKLSLRNYSGLNAAKCILWSPHFSKIMWKKTLYLIKMITVFSFFKLSISWGPIGMSGFFFLVFFFFFLPSLHRCGVLNCSYSRITSLPSPQLSRQQPLSCSIINLLVLSTCKSQTIEPYGVVLGPRLFIL